MITLKYPVYAVQMHPDGGSRFIPLAQIIHSNKRQVLAGEWPRWVTLSLERDAGAAKQELLRIQKEIRSAKSGKEKTEQRNQVPEVCNQQHDQK